jgi:hypothetical protein
VFGPSEENTSLVAESAKGRAAGGIGDLANLQRADMPMQACASLCGGRVHSIGIKDSAVPAAGLFGCADAHPRSGHSNCPVVALRRIIKLLAEAGPVPSTSSALPVFDQKKYLFLNNSLCCIFSWNSSHGNGYGNRMQISQTS